LKHDPFQRLFDAVDPVKVLSDADIDALVPTEDLVQRILRQEENKPRVQFYRRISRRTAIISTVAVLVVAGAATAVTFLRSPVSNTSLVSCYSHDSLHSKVIAVPTYAAHPLASCQTQLHWKPTPKGATPSGFLCVLSNGTLGGFPPSNEIENCAKLGLVTFNGKLKYPGVLKFEGSAHRYFSVNSCASVTDARKQMLRLIRRFKLSGWQVQIGGSRSAGSCATFGMQSQREIVNIVGLPK